MPPETLASVVDAVCAALRSEDTLISLRELSGSGASPFVAAAALLLLPSVRAAVRRTTPRWCPHSEFVCLLQSVAEAPESLVVSPDGLWLRLAEPVAPLSDTAAARARAGCEDSQAGHFADNSCAASRVFGVVLLPADPLLLPREAEVSVPSGGCILAALASLLCDTSPLRPALAPSPPLGARPKPSRLRGEPRLFSALPVDIRYGDDDNSDSLRPNPRASWLAGTALRGDAVLAHIALPPRNWGGVASTHRRLDVRDETLATLGVLAAASLPSGLGLDDHPGDDNLTAEASPKSALLELCSRFVPCRAEANAADGDDNDGDDSGCGVAFATAAAPPAPPPPPADVARGADALRRGCSFAAEHAAASGHVWSAALSEELARLLSAAPPPPQRARGFVTALHARRLLPRSIGEAGDVSDGGGGAGALPIDRPFVVRAWGATKGAAEVAASAAALRSYQAQGEALLRTNVLSLRAQPKRSSSLAASVPSPSFLEPGSDGEGDDAACVVDDGVGGAKQPPRALAPRMFWPPLADQRRAFVSAVVRSACGGAAASVLDLGCGSGELLCLLLNAATHRSSPMRAAAGVELSPRRAAEAARSLATALAPSPPPQPSHAHPPPPRCRVACGSLFSAHTLFYPGEFDIVTCIEVIEHLPESDADELGRLILRRLAPRVAVVTTPNAECNARMGAWGGHGGGDGGAHTRGFRDADHKFEWSRSEMRAWAARAAAACAAEGGHTYAVSFAEIGGVLERRGSESDEDGGMMGASQAAVFTRLGGETSAALSGAGDGAGGQDEKLSILWDSVQ